MQCLILDVASRIYECTAAYESGRRQPHSKTCRMFGQALYLAKRHGVRLPSAALPLSGKNAEFSHA
jgi:hypothetical protein